MAAFTVAVAGPMLARHSRINPTVQGRQRPARAARYTSLPKVSTLCWSFPNAMC
jgi:hypothetical protein